MSNRPSALESAFRENAAEGGAVLGLDVEPHQLDLLRDSGGRLPSDVFRRARAGDAGQRGRPLGARNKRNAKLAKLIVQQHGDPVMFMASVYAMPLDQLTELLQVADGSAARSERMLEVIEEVAKVAENMQAFVKLGLVDVKKLNKLTDAPAGAVSAAADLKTKSGELAVKALAAQIISAKETAPYVHGKQPLSVEVKGKADMVLLVPGLNAPADIDPLLLQAAVEEHGLEAIDFDNMRMIEHAPLPEDALAEDDDDDE